MPIYRTIHIALTTLAFVVLLAACRGGYSFTGASLSPDTKTITIAYFQNMAPVVMPTLSNTFTETLTSKFRQRTRLTFMDFGGDLSFEGEITNYDVQSIAIQANEQAAQNRLTITVKVRYMNAQDDKQNFDRSFSEYEDFSAALSLDAVQDDLIPRIVDKLTESIFNASVANW
ncbi:MAG: LPS assembly lipoprotein LptE [Prevotellaceae bacterium]|nr:LPS assembly lipoprotein LptE [Prevotellaceae bacterium]